jgi:large subunit ribosomal protein L10
LPIHRRPSVTEQSVEGPGTTRRPTQEDEATSPARAGVSQRPGRFLRRGVRRSSVITDDRLPTELPTEEVCMAKADKATAVADIAEQFTGSTATLITEYRGLTVANLAELRRSLAGSATYTVAKNTLIKRAASAAGIEGLDELFAGPTAIAFVSGEPVDAAKAIKTFAKDNKALVIKGGYMDGHPLTVAEVERIADLESREVLLAKLAGAMKGNLAKAAGLFSAPASQVARLAAALQEKKAAEAPPAAPTPAAETPAEEAPATEAPAEPASEEQIETPAEAE